MENERRGRQCHVYGNSGMIEPSSFESKSSSHRENIKVSVNETTECQKSEGLVEVDGIFLCEQLFVDV